MIMLTNYLPKSYPPSNTNYCYSLKFQNKKRGRRGRDTIVGGFTFTQFIVIVCARSGYYKF
jgi:hypothetical protein